MSSKNYGPAVSGYLDPTGRNWENPVFQSGKPVLDKELNLVEDLSSGFGQAALRRMMPSGWISDDFTLSSDMTSGIFTPSPIANTLVIPNGLVAHVNGWLLDVSYTGSTSTNTITLPAPPVGAGAMRTDLVVLEVWRRLISASTPNGKSPLGRIWRSGNVKITTDAAPYTLDDDILDTNVGSETTKRVQIQYRLRVIPGIDVAAYPYGMSDPVVVAHTVPTTAGTPDGTPVPAYLYSNQSSNGDGGLWVAGDGSVTAQTALGTVDGFMYALPLMAVFRRNSTAFDRVTNHNGGVPTPGPSDRPDGLFSDVLVPRDIYDLRTGVSPNGWDYREILTKNFNYLLDNAIRTDVGTTFPVGGGNVGHSVLVADEIGLLPGAPPLTGDTPGANFIGQFDNVRRYFTDRPNAEVVVLAISRSGGGNWVTGDIVQIDPTALPAYPMGPFNWSSRNPYMALWVDILNPRFVGETAGKRTNVAAIASVTNLSAYPLVPLQVKLGTIPPGTTNERLFLELVIEYPAGLGLSYTPTATYFLDSIEVNNPAALPGTPSQPIFDATHREVGLLYTPFSYTTITQMAEPVAGATSFRLPEIAADVSNVQKNGSLVSWGLNLDGRTVDIYSTTTSPTDVLSVTYLPLRPLPEGSVQVTLYYETRVPQTAREALLGSTIQVYPRHIDESIYVLTVGSGSPGDAYPFSTAYVQMGGISTPLSPYLGDHELRSDSSIYTAVFNSDTGFLKLPIYIPYTPNTEQVVFNRIPGDVDVEGRTFFPEANYVPPVYVPNAYAQPLTDPKRHRNILPMLAELAVDGPLGPKGQLVMVLLIREALFDADNSIAFDINPGSNTTVASVFRIKGHLLNKRA